MIDKTQAPADNIVFVMFAREPHVIRIEFSKSANCVYEFSTPADAFRPIIAVRNSKLLVTWGR